MQDRVKSRPDAAVHAAPPPAPAFVRPSARRHVVVGIAELAVSADPGDVIVTHALGSCIAVCLWDQSARVAGMLHFLLPEARLNPVRAREQPASFADSGIPLLLQQAAASGADRRRMRVRLVGGAEVNRSESGSFNVGRRNILAAKNVLWRLGLFVDEEVVGGTIPRTVHMMVADGRLLVSSGRDVVADM